MLVKALAAPSSHRLRFRNLIYWTHPNNRTPSSGQVMVSDKPSLAVTFVVGANGQGFNIGGGCLSWIPRLPSDNRGPTA